MPFFATYLQEKPHFVYCIFLEKRDNQITVKEGGRFISRLHRREKPVGVLKGHREPEKKASVFHGQDPFIESTNKGTFVLFQSHNYTRLTIRESKTIEDLPNAPEETVWKPDKHDEFRFTLWAPEGHTFPGTPWQDLRVISVAASRTGDSEYEEPIVLVSDGDDPRGPYEIANSLTPGEWGIDLTYYQERGQLYGIWSKRLGDDPFPQGIFIAPMDNPWTLNHREARCISSPQYPWEFTAQGEGINEGPQVRRKKDQLLISTSGSWTPEYAMTVLDRIGDDVIDPRSWRKRPTPIYKKNHGHGHTIELADGRELIVAGRKLFDSDGWEREIVWDDVSATTLDQTPDFAIETDLVTFAPKPIPEAGFSNVA